MAYSKNSTVKWSWGQGEAKGTIQEVFTSDVTRTIKGNEVKREASDDCPAYLIEQEDGDRVLKSHFEVQSA